jgi:nicotinamidase-related amidase
MQIPTLTPAKTALVVIDLQQGITAIPTEPRPASVVVANTLELCAAVRARGGFVVLVRVGFSADRGDVLRPECDSPSALPAQLPPSWFEYVPGLVEAGDHLLTKKQWGAFTGTDLDLQLRRRGISTIVLTGISTSAGVESTARHAYELGYHQVLVEDAMAARTVEEHEHAVKRIFPRLGRVRSTEEVLAGLEAK